MYEQCGDCGGCFGVGAPHVCDPVEMELYRDFKKQAFRRQAEEFERAAKWLDADYLGKRRLSLIPAYQGLLGGFEQAIKDLRNEAARLRAL